MKRDYLHELNISLEKMFEKNIPDDVLGEYLVWRGIKPGNQCSSCNGTGYKDFRFKCPVCQGSGSQTNHWE